LLPLLIAVSARPNNLVCKFMSTLTIEGGSVPPVATIVDGTDDVIINTGTASLDIVTFGTGFPSPLFDIQSEGVFSDPSTDWTITNNGNGTALLQTAVAQPTIQIDGNQLHFQQPPSGSTFGLILGADSGAELVFTDKTVFVENADNANLVRLYSAAFDRAPDAQGLSGWETILTNNIPAAAKAGGIYQALALTDDGSGTSIAGGFLQSAEFQAKYGNLDDSHFVTQLYLNVLNRTPDPTEVNGWLNLMHNGDAHGTHYTQEMVLVGFAESPENIAKTAHAGWLIEV
jgi:hypothetical protein